VGLNELQVTRISDFCSRSPGEEESGLMRDPHLEEVMELASSYGLDRWIQFDPTIVRGVEYYTGVVFEVFDRFNKFRAIAGGGRYDTLVESLGCRPIPGVGFGFGDAVITELLKERGLLPSFNAATFPKADIVVWTPSSCMHPRAASVSSTLRNQGWRVDFIVDDKKSAWTFRRAVSIGAVGVVVVGGEEWNTGARVRVKRLSDKVQVEIPVKALQEELPKFLGRNPRPVAF